MKNHKNLNTRNASNSTDKTDEDKKIERDRKVLITTFVISLLVLFNDFFSNWKEYLLNPQFIVLKAGVALCIAIIITFLEIETSKVWKKITEIIKNKNHQTGGQDDQMF